MDNKYIPTTGDRFLYEKKVRMIFVSFSLKEEININVLRKTKDAMMKRCPYLNTKKTIKNNLYHIEETYDILPIIENDGYVLIGDKRALGFLLTIAYKNNTIYFCYHHALVDNKGAVRFALSFVCEYLRSVHKKEFSFSGDLRPDRPMKPEEYENPYNHIIHQENPYKLKSKHGFGFPKEDFSNNIHRLRLYVSIQDILKLSKNAESTVASVLVMLLCMAIERVYPMKEKPIVVYCPVDIRNLIDCKDTLMHSCLGIKFTYSKQLKKFPFNDQLSSLKGMLILQSSEEYLLDVLEKQKINHEQICKNSNSVFDIEEKYNSVKYTEPVVSYLKTIDLDSIKSYIEDFDTYAYMNDESGIKLISYCIEDKCVINIKSILKTEEIFRTFLDALQELSIPYKILDKEGFGTEDYHKKDWLGL